MSRKAGLGLLALAMAATGLIVTAPSASAATGRVLADPDLNVRDAPGGGNLIGHIPKGTTITIDCTERGVAVSGGPYGTSSIWDGINYGGRRAFVSDAWVYTGSNGAVAGDCPDWPVVQQAPPTTAPPVAAPPVTAPPVTAPPVTSPPTTVSAPAGGAPYAVVAINVLRCVDRSACGTTQVITTFNAGQALNMECWQDGYTATVRYTSQRWFYVSGGGIKGFVHSGAVERQTPVGRCSDVSKGHPAADWALAHYGVTSVTASERNGNDMWPDNRWNGLCLLFAGDAWRIGANAKFGSYGTAANATNVFANRLQQGTPPRGALVFWGKNVGGHGVGAAGHVAISLGNGEMMTTQGYGMKDSRGKPEAAKPITILPINQLGTPSGWVVL